MINTKKMSYIQILDSLNEMQNVILDVINSFEYPVCDRQIAEYSGISINVVTARRNELAQKGLICVRYVGFSPYTKRKVNFWR